MANLWRTGLVLLCTAFLVLAESASAGEGTADDESASVEITAEELTRALSLAVGLPRDSNCDAKVKTVTNEDGYPVPTEIEVDRESCVEMTADELRARRDGHSPVVPTKYGVELQPTPLTPYLLSILQERREKLAESCLACEDGKCKFIPDLAPLDLGYCVSTFALPKRLIRNQIIDRPILKNRTFTVGFRIGKSGRATGVRVKKIKGGQTNRRDANKLMKAVLTSWVFEPIVVGGEKLALEGLYVVFDYGVVRKF